MITALFAMTLHAAVPCSADVQLERAAAAYGRTHHNVYTQQIEVRVPGAPRHEEELDFSLNKKTAVISMPSLYTIELGGGRLRIVENGKPNAHVSVAEGDDLQQSLDAVFGGAGSPVIPPPVLLRRARTADQRKQAFRLKILRPFVKATCKDDQVTLHAENGDVRFRVEDDGTIHRIDASIVTALGQPKIEATVKFAPRSSKEPLSFHPVGKAVSFVSQLAARERAAEVMPDVVLRTLDGAQYRLRENAGKTTIVEFWATWCAPCRMTLPQIAEFSRSRKDIRVILVNLSEDAALIRSYLTSARIDLLTLIDAGALHQAFGGGLPLTVVFSADGRVLKRHAGFDPDMATWLRTHL